MHLRPVPYAPDAVAVDDVSYLEEFINPTLLPVVHDLAAEVRHILSHRVAEVFRDMHNMHIHSHTYARGYTQQRGRKYAQGVTGYTLTVLCSRCYHICRWPEEKGRSLLHGLVWRMTSELPERVT